MLYAVRASIEFRGRGPHSVGRDVSIEITEPRLATDRPAALLPQMTIAEPRVPAELWQLIRTHNVVSFDVFDTLLVRQLARPVDVFELVARRARLPRFPRLRIAAETRARERNHEQCGHREIGLHDIYRELRKDVGKVWQSLMAAELDAERLVLRPNPAIWSIFEAASAAGATIVAVSDTYLPGQFVEECLEAAGFSLCKVFVSGEAGESKHQGDIFGHVAGCLGVELREILHIGDNPLSDFTSALKAGCTAWYLTGNSDRLFRDTRHNQQAISRVAAMEGNLFAALTLGQTAIANAPAQELEGAALFGRMYAGPMLLGFAMWIEQMRKLEGVKRLYLLARDGYAVDTILDALGSSAERVVVHSSRRMCLMAVLEQEFAATCLHIASSGLGACAREVITGLQLQREALLLEALDGMIDLDREISNIREIERFAGALRHCREILVSIAREESEALAAYVKQLRLTDPDAALVDCGWALSTHRRLEMLAGGKIRGYYVGTVDHAYHHDMIRSFLFERGVASPWKEIHADAVELLELPFITLHPQAIRMIREQGAVAPVFSQTDMASEAVRQVFAAAIRREALAFCRGAASLAPWLRTSEAEETLLLLFQSLAQTPTSFEYYSLSGIPHTRALGTHGLTTIGAYWRCSFTPAPVGYETVTRGASHYLRLGVLSLRRDGALVTFYRTRRRIRLWLSAVPGKLPRLLAALRRLDAGLSRSDIVTTAPRGPRPSRAGAPLDA